MTHSSKNETAEARWHREQVENACERYEFDPKRGTHKLRKFDFCKRCRMPRWAHKRKRNTP